MARLRRWLGSRLRRCGPLCCKDRRRNPLRLR